MAPLAALLLAGVMATATGGGGASEGRDGYPRREWTVHLQAGAGVVADSVPESEYEETVNKAAALARAVDLAEVAFANAKKK